MRELCTLNVTSHFFKVRQMISSISPPNKQLVECFTLFHFFLGRPSLPHHLFWFSENPTPNKMLHYQQHNQVEPTLSLLIKLLRSSKFQQVFETQAFKFFCVVGHLCISFIFHIHLRTYINIGKILFLYKKALFFANEKHLQT